jgi:hypothetical protein
MIDGETDIRLRAEKCAGHIHRTMAERGERARSSDTLCRGSAVLPREEQTLAELGVTKTQSSRWQKLAELPDDKFEERVAAAKKRAVASLDSKAEKQERRQEREAELASKIIALPLQKLEVILADRSALLIALRLLLRLLCFSRLVDGAQNLFQTSPCCSFPIHCLGLPSARSIQFTA